ncbi:hypothetical protein DL98DRAFT_565718 [Cadophora sp. DSE1049]|nr:hypothetical protein DL98DRAFT_565718 [Cadophora sp. DSE1049]
MTSRQAKQTGEKSKQHRRKSTRVSHESKNLGHFNEGASASYQEQPATKEEASTSYQAQPETPQHPLSQVSQTSEYQDTSSTDLPPSTTWPNSNTVPSHSDMNSSLLGLTLSAPTSLPAQHSYFLSPYCQTTHQCQHHYHNSGHIYPGAGNGGAVAEMYVMTTSTSTEMLPTGYGMTAMGRWSAEQPSQQGALLTWEKQQDEDLADATRWGLKRF